MIKSAEEFVKLRTSEVRSEYLRTVNEEVEIDVFHELISNYPEMKSWVVLNKNVPMSILYLLVDDDDTDVRLAVAMKRKLDYDLFKKLAMDLDESVRQSIAYNNKVPTDILELLANDSSEMVASVAKDKLNI